MTRTHAANYELFPGLCADLTAPHVAAHGFAPAGELQQDISDGGLRELSLVFRRPVTEAKPHYLLVQLVTLRGGALDAQWVQILLGEGDPVGIGPECNSASIWELTKAATGNAPTTGYVLRPGNDLAAALQFAIGQLLAHAADFLAGDLSNFRRVRALRDAEPPSS